MRRALATRSPVALLLAGLALGCEGGPGAATSEEAARADSSAAGYDVGTTPSTTTTPVPSTDSARTSVASAGTPVTPSQPSPRRDSAPPPARPDSTRQTAADTGRASGGETVTPPRRPAGAVTVNEFLAFDSRTKTVTLSLVAGYNSINNSLNFNGGIRGNHAVVVPVGWAVLVGVTNRDADLAHSAVVIAQTLPLPAEPPAPAFPGARLEDAEKGINAGDTMAMFFSAQRPGEYMIVCGVSGHAQGGEWLRLTVSATAAEPAYR